MGPLVVAEAPAPGAAARSGKAAQEGFSAARACCSAAVEADGRTRGDNGVFFTFQVIVRRHSRSVNVAETVCQDSGIKLRWQ